MTRKYFHRLLAFFTRFTRRKWKNCTCVWLDLHLIDILGAFKCFSMMMKASRPQLHILLIKSCASWFTGVCRDQGKMLALKLVLFSLYVWQTEQTGKSNISLFLVSFFLWNYIWMCTLDNLYILFVFIHRLSALLMTFFLFSVGTYIYFCT